MKRNNVTAFMSIAGGRVAVILVSTLVTPMLTRYMETSQYGAYGVIMAIFGLLMILASSGINSGVRKYLAEKRDAEGWTSNVFGFYFRVAFVLAIIPAAVLAGVAYFGVVESTFGPAFIPYFYLLAILTLAAQFREYVRRALMGLELEHISEPIKVLHKVAFGVFAVSGVLIAPDEYKVMAVLLGEILASSVAAAVAFYFIRQRVSLASIVKGVPSEFPKRELISFNSLTVVYIFLLTSMYHVDVLMVQNFTNTQSAGIYKGALVIVGFLWLVPRSVQSVMIQSASGHWADGNIEKINEMASQATRYTLLFTLLLSLGLGALATTFVPLYLGEDYAAAVLPVILLLPGTLGFAVARPIFAISHAKGELKVVIAATGGAAVLNFVLNALLIPTPENGVLGLGLGLGMIGAATATTVGYASLPLFHVFGARHIGFQPFEDARLGRITLTGILAGIPIVFLSLVFSDSLLGLLVVPPVGGLLYGTFALLTGAIDLDEVLSVLVAMPAPIGPRARTLRGRARNASSPIGALSLGSAKSYAIRIAIVVAVISLVAGFSVAIGLEQPDVDVSSNATSTPTQTSVADGTPGPGTSTKAPTASPDGSPSATPTSSGTPPPSETPTTGGPTATPSATPTGGGTPTAGGTPTSGGTPTPASTPQPTPTATTAPTPSSTPQPTASPTPQPTTTTTATTASTTTTTATTASTTSSAASTTQTGEANTSSASSSTPVAAFAIPLGSWLTALVALTATLAEAVARVL